ncbi:hypothetical protein ABFT23_18190 [Nocardioides sp. C4-1]|uniref:hypothetical protein n=1 Tax=Nocardioides sp. C4-1 TaxID=3151851 RepID=UPI00326603CD
MTQPPSGSGDDRETTALPISQSGREVVCPECGTVARVTVNRRESLDFCSTCDFPLFWTPSQVVLGDVDLQAQAALRRLPGTAGRSTVGSLACPHCAEANPVSGVLCLRCGGDLHPVLAAPPPAPAPEPAPALPEPEPEPEGFPAWWLYVGVATIALVVLVAVVLIRQ